MAVLNGGDNLYAINESSKRIIAEMREQAAMASRIRTSENHSSYPSPAHTSFARLVGLAIITAAGSDADHWQWQFAYRDTTSGKFTAGLFGYVEMGECSIADARGGATSMAGIMYIQLNDDDTTELILAPISSEASGMYIGMVRQVVSANSDGYDWEHLHSLGP